MQYEVTPWMKKNENGWVAIDQDTHDVIDRDLVLSKLLQRLDDYKVRDYTLCRNWFRPVPFRDDIQELERHRAFLRENRDPEELERFEKKIATPPSPLGFDPRSWPLTLQRKVALWCQKKARQLKDLLTP